MGDQPPDGKVEAVGLSREAERVYASTLDHFPKIKLLDIASRPLAGKARTPEQFLAKVHEGAWVNEAQCKKA